MFIISIFILIVIQNFDVVFLVLYAWVTRESPNYVISVDYPIIHGRTTILIFFLGWFGVGILMIYLFERYYRVRFQIKDIRFKQSIHKIIPIPILFIYLYERYEGGIAVQLVFVAAYVMLIWPAVVGIFHSYRNLLYSEGESFSSALYGIIFAAVTVQVATPLLLLLKMEYLHL